MNDKLNLENSLTKILEAENHLKQKQIDRNYLLEFLDFSRKSDFLMSLKNETNRAKWVDLVFKILQRINFSFLDLYDQRLREHPDKTLFLEKVSKKYRKWTYKQIYAHAREIAAFFYKHKPEKPKVLIFQHNSVETATIDLACLMFDIYDTPLNVHFNAANIIQILNQIQFDFIVTDTVEKLKIISEVLEKISYPIKVIVTNNELESSSVSDYYLSKECRNMAASEVDKILSERSRKPINQVATTMFTSGSTGVPKGVSFSIYNIVSKRFARAAALPEVGNNEVFVCYLPLFHTFGRYLEMTGSIFWGGTYVMSDTPSFSSLSRIFIDVNPTGFISVPVRWQQFYDKIMASCIGSETEEEMKDKITSVIGKNLSWGLSAAGFLEPKVFKFFHKYGVSLNSGFGMTEATGGITMTKPFAYVENSVGIPLPGMCTRLNDNNELEICSHYVGYPLADAGYDDFIAYPQEHKYWYKTGDIFTIDDSGQHRIIDRVKDIYKNNKGQTISPLTVEAKFDGVPGLKRTFLVGDGRPYNVLLIITNKKDPIFRTFGNEKNIHDYFKQIVIAANADLAPYERVVNFTIIDRDFCEENDELTPKGSYKRKNIERNFKQIIKQLYVSENIEFTVDNYRIIIPRWLIRNLGIMETDISLKDNTLINNFNNKKLRVQKCSKDNFFVVGDLAYKVKNNIVDIGRIVRQPKLWVANPQLSMFSPLNENYDLPLKNFYLQVCIPEIRKLYSVSALKNIEGIKDSELVFLDNLLTTILHTDTSLALKKLRELGDLLANYNKNKRDIIRRRLESLACHQVEKIRVLAYQILVSMTPDDENARILPSFINSGKTFLTEQSIVEISKRVNIRQLHDLRLRMNAYRRSLSWPANKIVREQFVRIFNLLYNFGINKPIYYKSLRAELVCWVLLDGDQYLAEQAKKFLLLLKTNFKNFVNSRSEQIDKARWDSFFVFDEGINEDVQEKLKAKFKKNNFLKLTVFLTYDDYKFNYKSLSNNSILVSKVRNYGSEKEFRLSINTTKGKHFDIHVFDLSRVSEKKMKILFRHIILSDLAFDSPSVSSFGYLKISENIYTMRYISRLSAWDKIRSMAEIQKIGYLEDKNFWRKIYIRSMGAFYKAWNNMNRNVMPGLITPENVVVPEIDFFKNEKILSLDTQRVKCNITDLLTAAYINFYEKTVAHYPYLRKYLKMTWIFHSLVEVLGKKEAIYLINEFIDNNKNSDNRYLLNSAKDYVKKSANRHYLPLALFNAIDKYTDWVSKNIDTNAHAKIQTIDELFELYKLKDLSEIVRYKFYKETYFANHDQNIIFLFDQLLDKMFAEPEAIAVQFTELSDFQSVLSSNEDRLVFNKMVFPDIEIKKKLDFRKFGDRKTKHLVVCSKLIDKNNIEYTMREPIDAGEVGEVYKLFYQEHYPKEVSQMDKYYVVINKREQVIGGMCYKELEDNIVLIDGMAITSALQSGGIGSQMMTDFITRMKAKGTKMIKAHFLFGNYYLKHNFKIDNNWGALVYYL